MKNNKILIILVIIVSVLIAFFTTKIILENKYSSKYEDILEEGSWHLVKVEGYENGKTEIKDEQGIIFVFNKEKLNICYENLCDESSYSIKDNKLKIKENKNGFNGNYDMEYIDDILTLKLTEGNIYVKYYLVKPLG